MPEIIYKYEYSQLYTIFYSFSMPFDDFFAKLSPEAVIFAFFSLIYVFLGLFFA